MNINHNLNRCMSHGLRSLSQVRLLMAIEQGRDLKPGHLSESAGIHPSNYQVMFRQLVKLGLVYGVSERLTPKGRRLIKPLLQNDTP